MSDKESCSSCKFFKNSVEGKSKGVCRSRPPTAVVVEREVANTSKPKTGLIDAASLRNGTACTVESVFPVVSFFDWCGEWMTWK